MTLFRWLILIVVSGLINAALFFAVPLANALLVVPPKHEYKSGSNNAQVVVDTRIKPHEMPKKEIRQIAQQAKSFKPTRASAGAAHGMQMDLSLAGGEGSGGVAMAAGGSGNGVGVGGGGGLGAEVYDPSQVDQEAKVLREEKPAFPPRAHKEGVNGYVKLYLVIDVRGMVSEVQVLSVQPQGYGFEIEAQKAIRQFRFEPAKLKGFPVAQKATKEFVFDLGY